MRLSPPGQNEWCCRNNVACLCFFEMAIYVLKSRARSGQTRFVSNYRNGRSRVVAFDSKRDAKNALKIVKDTDLYQKCLMEVCETNTARLVSDVSGHDIAVDYCAVHDSEIEISRTVIMKSQRQYNDVHTSRMRLERDYALAADEVQ